MQHIDDWLIAVLLAIFVFPFQGRGATGCDAALKNIGGAIELYQITTGKHPANLADLYKEGFVKNLAEFTCPDAVKTIASLKELEEKADFTLVKSQTADPKAPLVMIAGKEGTPGRAYLSSGELVGGPPGDVPRDVSDGEESEPNNKREEASVVAAGQKARGKISPRRDVDYYRVKVDHQGALAVKIEPVPKELDIAFRVMNSEGKVVRSYVRQPKAGAPTEGVVDLPVRGSYYLEVHDWGNNAESEEPYELALTFSPTADVAEPNDEREQASSVTMGISVKANILPRRDVDYYRVEVDHQGALAVKIDPVPKELDLAFRVMNSKGKVIQSYVRPPKRGAPTEGVVDLPAAGQYYLELHDWGNDARSSESYALNLGFTPTADGTEPNNTFETASPVPVAKPVKGNILPRKDVDLYWLAIAHQGALAVKVGPVPKELEVALRVFDSEGKVIRSYVRPAKRGDATEAIVDLKGRGTYYLELHDWGNTARSSEPYELYLSFTGTADDTEPNDSRETASAISIGEVVKANILPRKDVDLYSVRVDKPGTLGVDITAVPAELEVAIRVMDASGKVVRSYVRPKRRGAPTKAIVELSMPGTYYLEVHDWGHTARSSDAYSLTTSFSPAG